MERHQDQWVGFAKLVARHVSVATGFSVVDSLASRRSVHPSGAVVLLRRVGFRSLDLGRVYKYATLCRDRKDRLVANPENLKQTDLARIS